MPFICPNGGGHCVEAAGLALLRPMYCQLKGAQRSSETVVPSPAALACHASPPVPVEPHLISINPSLYGTRCAPSCCPPLACHRLPSLSMDSDENFSQAER